MSGATVSKNVLNWVTFFLFFTGNRESHVDSTVGAMFPQIFYFYYFYIFRYFEPLYLSKTGGDIKTNMEVLGRLRLHF